MRAHFAKGLLAVLAISGVVTGAWWAFRNPVADLQPHESTKPSGSGPRPKPAAGQGQADAAKRPVDRPPARPGGYVGSAVCGECHSEVFEEYQHSPMARSLAAVLDAKPIEDYTQEPGFRAPPSTHFDVTLRYYAERTSEGVRHHERAVGPEGEVIYDQAVPIHFAVGSGQRGRSYITNRDGILLMSPMSWYTGKGRWDLSPGHDLNNMRFERRIVEGCLSCHAGLVALPNDAAEDGLTASAGLSTARIRPHQPNRFASDPFVEIAIGCERCHGPGEEHVRYRESFEETTGADPIVNPADLDPFRRDSVCYQCHFAGEQRLPRYGRSHFDFRPGDRVTDIWTIFVRGTGVGEDQTTKAVSQTEQMLSSVCYRESGGRMGCISCHDSHSIPSPETRIAFYRSRCLDCHGSPEHAACSLPEPERLAVTAEDSCIECHMPRIKANDVPHTSQTDHRILRLPDTSEQAGPPGESLLTAFGFKDGLIPEAEVDRARGLLLFIEAERRDSSVLAAQAIPLLEHWSEKAPDDGRVAEALGGAYYMNREVAAAFSVWERALSLNPDNEDILRRMVAAYHNLGRLDEGIRHAQHLVRLNRWYHDDFGRLAHMLGQQRRFPEAIEAALRAVELNPAATTVHGWLSEAYGIVGQPDKARKHRRLYEKLKPRERP